MPAIDLTDFERDALVVLVAADVRDGLRSAVLSRPERAAINRCLLKLMDSQPVPAEPQDAQVADRVS